MKRKPPIWKRLCDAQMRRGTAQHGRSSRDLMPTMTVGRARAVLEAGEAAGLAGASKINPELSRARVFKILSGAVEGKGAVSGKYDDELLHFLVAKNIGREFGAAAKHLLEKS